MLLFIVLIADLASDNVSIPWWLYLIIILFAMGND